MCGIAGALDARVPVDMMRARVLRMVDAIRHRGPDDAGVWVDAGAQIGLGQRRLSIIDLSPAGHQPMLSESGRHVIVFNGEIYNFNSIRRDIDAEGHGVQWRGHSDTEVLLAAIELWGIPLTLGKLNGMFAFAVWDRHDRTLCLARDRMGEKPLYYCWQQGAFLFGSELKALRAYPGFATQVDRNALALYFRHNCIPGPYTIYENVWKLPPASWMKIRPGENGAEPVAYWSAQRAAAEGQRDRLHASDSEVIEHLDTLLRNSVSLRMVSDVPLGVFLSGGIDSSLVAALMQEQSARPVRSFSIGFHEPSYNEASEAKAVARHLRTDHTQLYVTPVEARDTIPFLPVIYDEPFSDSSQIPTYLLARLTRRYVTVALSGDGGDEVFGGYNRHAWIGRIWKAMGRMPTPARRVVAQAFAVVAPDRWDALFRTLEPVLPSMLHQRGPGDKLHKLAGALVACGPVGVYRQLTSHWTEEHALVVDAIEPPTLLTRSEVWADVAEFSEQMMYLDSVTYLPDDILVKVDRASMAVSLEGRMPYLDHRLVEFSWRLPISFKLRDGKSKWALRQVLARYVPPTLTERPKTGFAVPIGSWLRGPLRDWAEALLDERQLVQQGLLNPVPIRQKWAEHLSGTRNWQDHLWDVLVFQMWLMAQSHTEHDVADNVRFHMETPANSTTSCS